MATAPQIHMTGAAQQIRMTGAAPHLRLMGAAPQIRLMGARFAAIDRDAAVRRILEAALAREGSWTLTANVDHLRRYRREAMARRLFEAADMVVADGTPLVWASRIAGAPLPERVAGSDMIWSIAEAAAGCGARLFLLGGSAGSAERAARVLCERNRGLDVCGMLCPPQWFESCEQELRRIEERLLCAAPDVVLVALGFPKQDLLIERLRTLLPGASFLGVGISFGFVAGEVRRAPRWTHALGLEWAHRLLQEPKRLAARYLLHGLPFAARLFAGALRHRLSSPVCADGASRDWGVVTTREPTPPLRGAHACGELAPPGTVHHFGPDPAQVGGMASVIRVLAEHRMGAERVVVHPTWRPGARLASARLTAGAARAIVRMRRGEVAHVHLAERGSFVREGALVLLARRRGVTTVATIHGARFHSFATRRERLTATVLGAAHLVTCLDREALELVRRLAPSVQAQLLPNPVPIDLGSPAADRTEELVLFAGEIGLRKGADVMQRAWRLVEARRPEARCVMVGPTTDFAVAGSERLEVHGPVGPAQMRELLRRARVVALPSRAEGMPMILTEAMSAGRPFVGTPVGAIPELAEQGGMLVAVGDAQGLAERLLELLENPVLARRIGEDAQRFCMSTRSVEVLDGRLRELYARARPAAGPLAGESS